MSSVAQILYNQNHSTNMILNGNFDIDQRFASTSSAKIAESDISTDDYIVDRWNFQFPSASSHAFTIWREDFNLGQVDVKTQSKKYLSIDWTTAGTSATDVILEQRIESVRRISDTKIGFGFYCFMPTGAAQCSVDLHQFFGTTGSPSTTVSSAKQYFTPTGTWQRFDFQFDVPSIVSKTLGTDDNDALVLQIHMPTNAIFKLNLSDVMFTQGSVKQYMPVDGWGEKVEISRLQRYFEKSYDLETILGTATTNNMISLGASTTNFWGIINRFNTLKKTSPTMTYWDSAGTLNKVSYFSVGSWVNGWGGVTARESYTTGFLLEQSTGITTPVNLHYAADAELAAGL